MYLFICLCDWCVYIRLLLLLLKDNPSFNKIGVGAPSRRNVSMGWPNRVTLGRRLILGDPPKTAPFLETLWNPGGPPKTAPFPINIKLTTEPRGPTFFIGPQNLQIYVHRKIYKYLYENLQYSILLTFIMYEVMVNKTTVKKRQSGIHVPENSKTERGGFNFVDPEKKYMLDACLETGSWWGLKYKTCGRSARPRKCHNLT